MYQQVRFVSRFWFVKNDRFSVDRLSPIDRSLKAAWPVGETAVEPKTPPLARRSRAIGDNGSTKGARAAGALGSVDRLSPIDRKLEGTEAGGRNSRRTEDAAADASW